MNHLEPLYDGVQVSLLAELRGEWLRYGWDEQDIDEKLAKLSRLWSAGLIASKTTVSVALPESEVSNKRKRDAEVRNGQKKQRVDTTSYDTKPLRYDQLARDIEQTTHGIEPESMSMQLPTSTERTSVAAESVASVPSVIKSEPTDSAAAVIPIAPIQLPYAGSIHIKANGDDSLLPTSSLPVDALVDVLTVEPLNSGDDDSSDDDVAVRSAASADFCVCSYDKVSHSKNRWKIQLRDGMLRVRGKDYVFSRANGEIQW